MKISELILFLSATLYSVSGESLKPDPATEWCGGKTSITEDQCCKEIQCTFEPKLLDKKRFDTSMAQSFPCSCFDELQKCRRKEGRYYSVTFPWFTIGNAEDYWPFSTGSKTICYDSNYPQGCISLKFLCSIFGDNFVKFPEFEVVEPDTLSEASERSWEWAK